MDVQTLTPVEALVAERTGTSLSPQQLARLQELLAGMSRGRSEDALVTFLKSGAGARDLAELMSAISVHKTDLFRDEIQLQAFRDHVLAPLARERRPIHLWSAGCATGEEVATLLILLEEVGAHPKSTVLGTDIAERALEQARAFTYHPYLFRRVPEPLQKKYFRQVPTGAALRPDLCERAAFRRHNLMDAPYPVAPGASGFDVIFCRNVLIYFTKDAFDRVLQGFTERLRGGGTLVLSSAEPILTCPPSLTTQRCDQAFFYVRSPEPELGRRLTPGRGTAFPPRPSRPGGSGPKATPIAGTVMPKLTPAGGTVVGTRLRREEQQAPIDDPLADATRLFEAVLESATSGEVEAETELKLRRCLYLDPHFAQARYLLAMILEQRGEKANAASEYRRALAALSDGRSRQTAFFLNDERLKTACSSAIRRLGFR